jgi:hypothetical protein
MRKHMSWTSILALVALATLAAACSKSATGPAGAGSISLSLTTGAATAVPSLGPSLSVSQTSGSNQLVLDSASIVLRHTELELQNGQCPTSGSPTAGDGCEEFEAGPMLLQLPLDGSVSQQVALNAPPGTYSQLNFEIHAPGSDSADQAFVKAHPAYQNASVRVVGTYNGTPFTYTSNLDVEQEQQLSPPLVVSGSSTSTNVTLQVDVSTWFKASDGSLIDPSTAVVGGTNESVVKDNIKASLKAFEDQNEDGVAD